MNKSLLTKIAIVVVLLIAFIGYTVYANWKNSHFTVDPEAFDIKDSIQAVLADENRDFDNRINLKLAAHYHLLKNINETAEVPKLHRQIQINKVWALPGQFYVLYSINLKKSDKSLYDVPELKFFTIQFHSKSGKTLKTKVRNNDRNISSGKVYHHRLYRGIIVSPDYDSFQSKMTLYMKVMKNLDKISLGNPTLIWKGEKSNRPKVPLNDLVIGANYSKSSSTFFTMPLHQQLTLDNEQTLTFKRLKAQVQGNLLYFSAKPDHKQIKNMYLKISGPWANGARNYPVSFENGLKFMYLPRFEDIPKQLKIEIKGISYVTNKNFQFLIPGWHGEENSQNVNKEVAKMLGAPLYFEGYTSLFPGPPKPDKIAFKLKINFPYLKKNSLNPNIYNLTTLQQVDRRLKLVKDKELRKKMKAGISGIVTFKNDKGKKPKFAEIIGSSIMGRKSSTYTFLLNKSYVEDMDHLKITVRQLPEFTQIKDKQLVINIPNKGH